MKNKLLFYLGILILVILAISYFIQIETSGTNYIISTPLLGILIFHSPIVLIVYILMASFLIYKGLGKKIKFV